MTKEAQKMEKVCRVIKGKVNRHLNVIRKLTLLFYKTDFFTVLLTQCRVKCVKQRRICGIWGLNFDQNSRRLNEKLKFQVFSFNKTDKEGQVSGIIQEFKKQTCRIFFV